MMCAIFLPIIRQDAHSAFDGIWKTIDKCVQPISIIHYTLTSLLLIDVLIEIDASQQIGHIETERFSNSRYGPQRRLFA